MKVEKEKDKLVLHEKKQKLVCQKVQVVRGMVQNVLTQQAKILNRNQEIKKSRNDKNYS